MSCTQNLHFVHISQLLNVPAFHKVTRSHDLCGAGDYNLRLFSASGDLLTALLLVFAETSPPLSRCIFVVRLHAYRHSYLWHQECGATKECVQLLNQ